MPFFRSSQYAFISSRVGSTNLSVFVVVMVLVLLILKQEKNILLQEDLIMLMLFIVSIMKLFVYALRICMIFLAFLEEEDYLSNLNWMKMNLLKLEELP